MQWEVRTGTIINEHSDVVDRGKILTPEQDEGNVRLVMRRGTKRSQDERGG